MSSDICLVIPCNTFIIPYFKVYDELLKVLNIKYDLIQWNRELIQENCFGNIISFDSKDQANSGNYLKAIKYIQFAHFVKKQIKVGKYKKIIFLCTAAGTPVLLHRFLEKEYRNKYWIDVRDYSLEFIPVYKRLLKKVLSNSYGYDVSSEGYFEFLPSVEKEYCVTHNIDISSIEQINNCDKINSDKIRISFIGNVRYFEINTILLKMFGNDSRFVLQYFGTGSEKLKNYCLENKIENVEFMGRFDPKLTPSLYAKTDIINNVYGNESKDVSTALSNKLYYAAFTGRPILVSPNTYMSRISNELSIGFDVDLTDLNTPNRLYDWYHNNYKPSQDIISKYKTKVLLEQRQFIDILNTFLRA